MANLRQARGPEAHALRAIVPWTVVVRHARARARVPRPTRPRRPWGGGGGLSRSPDTCCRVRLRKNTALREDVRRPVLQRGLRQGAGASAGARTLSPVRSLARRRSRLLLAAPWSCAQLPARRRAGAPCWLACSRVRSACVLALLLPPRFLAAPPSSGKRVRLRARRACSAGAAAWPRPLGGRPPICAGADRDLLPTPEVGPALCSAAPRRKQCSSCIFAVTNLPPRLLCAHSASRSPARRAATALVLASPVLAKTTNPAQFSYGG